MKHITLFHAINLSLMIFFRYYSETCHFRLPMLPGPRVREVKMVAVDRGGVKMRQRWGQNGCC